LNLRIDKEPTVSLSFAQKLDNYAELAVRMGAGLQAGQRLLIRAPIEAAELTRLTVESAYRAGAPLVEVLWADDATTLARYRYAPRDSVDLVPAATIDPLNQVPDRGDAVLSIYATDPDLLKDQSPELVAQAERARQKYAKPFFDAVIGNRTNWSIIAAPIPSWAARIFPDDTPEDQMRKLWDAMFATCRADQPDPVAAWQDHVTELTARRSYLTRKQYTALAYAGLGTELVVGLPENHVWRGGGAETPAGVPFVANIPTEEVFSMPHKDRVDGVVTATKPLAYAGNLITGLRLRFERGRVVEFEATAGEDILRTLLDTDEGARRLGEVALVPHSSPIADLGLLFYNTLFDENAASHLAVGRAYRHCLEDGSDMSDSAFAAGGGNDSLTHVDFMIGSAEINIDGVGSDGSREPVMRSGEWAFEV
jgi:aminopeptidase